MRSADRALAEGILFTDQYQLTMAQLYFRLGLHERHAQFDHFFRACPDYGAHQAGYCVNAGLESLLDWMDESRFGDDEIRCLAAQVDPAGNPLFGKDFLDWLSRHGDFSGIDLKAIPEGRVVHPNVPLTVVQGPLLMAQILETPLLNHLNYQTLVATKASRIHESGRGQPVLEFGLRRAQGRGATSGGRAALIGGADFTSNAGLSHALGYPPKGTHAHSMVQVFMALGEGELGAFRAYADVYPDSCLLLVDTISTLESGLPNAIRVFEELRRKGHRPLGIRLDSGDLAYLAIQSSRILDEAGFEEVKIVLSNQLDEMVIWQILTQIENEAPRYGVDAGHLIGRLVYGVGTRLIASEGKSALDGVYKLVAVNGDGGELPAIKLSESPDKILNPGNKLVWRLYDRRGKATADLMTLVGEEARPGKEMKLFHPTDPSRRRHLGGSEIARAEPLLEEVLAGGVKTGRQESIEEMRERRREDVGCLDPGVRRLVNPHIYHVSLSENLWNLKEEQARQARLP